MSSPQSLETIGDLESKLLQIPLSFHPIKAGPGGLIYQLEVVPIKIVISPNNLYDYNGFPLINSGRSARDAIDLYLEPSIDPKINRQLRFKEAVVQGPEFDWYIFIVDAPYFISDKYVVDLQDRRLGYLGFFRTIHNCGELAPAIKALTDAYSELKIYKNN